MLAWWGVLFASRNNLESFFRKTVLRYQLLAALAGRVGKGKISPSQLENSPHSEDSPLWWRGRKMKKVCFSSRFFSGYSIEAKSLSMQSLFKYPKFLSHEPDFLSLGQFLWRNRSIIVEVTQRYFYALEQIWTIPKLHNKIYRVVFERVMSLTLILGVLLRASLPSIEKSNYNNHRLIFWFFPRYFLPCGSPWR